ncbi:MAG: PIN domain-containing protein [Halopenitus sp.]
MTTYVETDFLLALTGDADWLTDGAKDTLEEHDVVTSSAAYLELLLIRDRHEVEYVTLFANMLELVPVGSEEERQIVLKSAKYFEAGLTAFDAFHVATAEARGAPVLGSDTTDDVDSERISLDSDGDE